jgi:UDP-glucose 4-epimerase
VGFQNKKIIVTGGAGFIGSHLVEHLVNHGARVVVADNFQAGRKENLQSVFEAVTIETCDVRQMDEVFRCVQAHQPEIIFHLAANASVPYSVENPVYDHQANCQGTVHVCEAVRQHAPDCKIVLASSGAVYGEPKAFPITENSPLKPISPYGVSKVAAEEVMRLYHEVYDLHTCVARLFNTYGPRMPRFVVLDFLRKLQADSSVLEILGSGKQVRDFNFVSDTVMGLCTVVTAGEPGQSYNLASGYSCSVTDLADLLVEVLKINPAPRYAFTGESWAGDAQTWEVSIQKLSGLGYRPLVELRDGLSAVINWHQSQAVQA